MEGKVVVAIVNYEGKILLGKKRSDSKKFLAGVWRLPGESVNPGESDEDALKRGLIEEAQLEITVGRYLGKDRTPSHKIVYWYECFSQTDKVDARNERSDLEDIGWFDKKDVAQTCGEKLTSMWPWEIRRYFSLE